MGRFSVSWVGLKQLERMARKDPGMAQDLKRAVYAEATTVLNESKKQVPYNTRALQSSGKVHDPEVTSAGVTIEISYGGAAAPYAIYVHEIPKNYRHGRKWKYLEDPVMAHEPKFERNVKERLVTYLRKRRR